MREKLQKIRVDVGCWFIALSLKITLRSLRTWDARMTRNIETLHACGKLPEVAVTETAGIIRLQAILARQALASIVNGTPVTFLDANRLAKQNAITEEMRLKATLREFAGVSGSGAPVEAVAARFSGGQA